MTREEAIAILQEEIGGKWYWWDVAVIDILAEYGEDRNAEQIDKDIEVVAWMPLPKPYKGGDSE